MVFVSVSWACGGFFCDGGPTGVVPVQQTREAIAFGVADGMVEMHVQVAYEGPPDEFAWVLPVPAEPEILRSSPGLFRDLEPWTRYDLRVRWNDWTCFADADADADTDTDTDTDTDGDGVTVVSRQEVGPYDAIVLEADDTQVLVTWLGEAGFNTPPGIDALLDPYASETTRYVALRLLPDREVGDIEPFALRYAGDAPSIPIQLTAVAATPDMPITVYVVGAHRAVPENYLHVELNPFAGDPGMPSQQALISRAADEAGGQAFATISATWTGRRLRGVDLDTAFLAGATSFADWIQLVQSPMAFSAAELARVVPLPDGVDPGAFFQCWQCFSEVVDVDAFDLPSLTAQLDAELLAPLRTAQALLDGGPILTRLESSMSADEMTLDPRFVFAPGLPLVAPVREIVVRQDCTDASREDAPHHISSGALAIVGPSNRELAEGGYPSVFAWLADTQDTAALRVERSGADGLHVLVDNTAHVTRFQAEPEGLDARSCGCASGGPGTGFALAGLFLALTRPRRFRASRG